MKPRFHFRSLTDCRDLFYAATSSAAAFEQDAFGNAVRQCLSPARRRHPLVGGLPFAQHLGAGGNMTFILVSLESCV